MDPLAVLAYGAEQAVPLIGTGTGGETVNASVRASIVLMSVSHCPTFRQLLTHILLSPRASLPSRYSACITLWLCPKVHPSAIMVLTQNSLPYAMYVIAFNVVGLP